MTAHVALDRAHRARIALVDYLGDPSDRHRMPKTVDRITLGILVVSQLDEPEDLQQAIMAAASIEAASRHEHDVQRRALVTLTFGPMSIGIVDEKRVELGALLQQAIEAFRKVHELIERAHAAQQEA